MLIRHSIIYFIGKVAPAILSIIGVMVYTRLASPDEYGLFSLITVVVGLINILFFQWIRSSFIRFYNDRKNINLFMGSIIKSHIGTLIVIGFPALIITFILYLKSLKFYYVIIGYLLLVLLSVFELLIVYFRTTLKPTVVVNVNLIKSLAVMIVSTVLLFIGWGALGLLFGVIFGLLSGIILYSKKISSSAKNKLTFESNKNTQKKFLKYGLPITLSFALSVALQNIDKIMISSILGLRENGSYSVSYDLIHNLIYMIMTSLSLASFPLVLKVIKKEGNKAGKREFEEYVRLLLFISIPAGFGLAAILDEFSTIIIGNEYSISNRLMILIILASLFHGLKSHYFDLTLQITSKTKHFFIPALTAVILNIFLNAYMLKIYGIDGAALATAISFFIAMLMSAFFSRKNYKVSFPWKDFLKIISSSSVMYFTLLNITIENSLLSLSIKVLAGVCIYVVLSFIVNSLSLRKLAISKLMKR